MKKSKFDDSKEVTLRYKNNHIKNIYIYLDITCGAVLLSQVKADRESLGQNDSFF